MKVTIEYEALLRLLVACGEAKGLMHRVRFIDGNYSSLRAAAANTQQSLEAALAEIVTAPAIVEAPTH